MEAKQKDLPLWLGDDPNETPFVRRRVSATAVRRPHVRAPSSVFDLARRPVRVSIESASDDGEGRREWGRDGDRVTGWGEMQRRRWEEFERERKSKTVAPATPDAARRYGRRKISDK